MQASPMGLTIEAGAPKLGLVMRYKAKNIAKTRLLLPCGPNDTVLTVEDGSALPDPPCVLFLGTKNNYEIVVCTAKTGNALNVQRGQEETTPKAWPAGTSIENRFTAGTYDTLVSGPETAELGEVPVFGDSSGKILDESGAIYVTNGMVGIGTKTPSQLLHVAGNVLVDGDVYLKSTDVKAASVTSAARTIWVDADNGNDSTGDGSAEKPYKTIGRALLDIPNELAHKIEIRLKAAVNAYAQAWIRNKVYVSPDAQLVIQGTMNVLESGSITQVLQNEPDPVYGAEVLVDKIVDLTKQWEPNAFQYKLLRVFKPDVGEHYRLIVYNDANSLYVSYRFTTPIPDATWQYEILDWGSKIQGLFLENMTGLVRLSQLALEAPSGRSLSIHFVQFLDIDSCAILKSAEKTFACSVQGSRLRLSSCYLDGFGTRYDGIMISWGTPTRIDIFGSIIRRFRHGIWSETTQAVFMICDGTRILADGADIASRAVRLDAIAYALFFATAGKVVLDYPVAIFARRGSRIGLDDVVYFGPNVALRRDFADGIGESGDLFILGNVGIGTQDTQGFKLYVNGSFYATSKSSDVKTPSGRFAFYALEATEHWFADFGSAKLERGQAIVKIDPIFRQAISEEKPYVVILSPTSACNGLYVAEKGRDYFIVRELRDGTSEATFDYVILGPRRGYEHIRLERIPEPKIAEALLTTSAPPEPSVEELMFQEFELFGVEQSLEGEGKKREGEDAGKVTGRRAG